ncbi:MAG: S8 family serine peptidase, partial [Alphaproteobacteria bacterium]
MNPVSDIPGLSALWQEASGGDPEIRIAIIDGPVDLDHPSLAGARLTFGGNTQGATASSVRSEHGTHVASVLMAQPGGPVLGIAPNATARLYSIYKEGEDGELLPSSQADLALAINRAVGDGAHLINISSGQVTPTGQAERILADAVRRCAEHGTLIVAAAGNDGCRCLHVPAALDTVLAVGACDLDGQPLAFSNYGGSYAINGILAPGQGIVGASPRAQAGVAMRSGTSFATPVVTGVAALLLSRLHQSGRDVDPQAVRLALLAGASPCTADEQAPGGRCLAGRLDVAGAAAILLANHPDRDAPQVAGLSASGTAWAPAKLERFEQRGSGQPTPPQIIRESTMSDTPNGGAVHTSQILGPDGNPLPAAVAPAAVGPSVGPEASAGPSAQTVPLAAPLATSALPLETESVQAQAASLGAPQMAGGAIAAATPTAGAMTPGLLPAQGPAMTSPAPPSPPQSPAAPVVQPSDAGCVCPGVLPAQVEEIGEQVFVIGRLYYDFGTEARLDYFIQAIANWRDSLGSRLDEHNQSFGPKRNTAGDSAAPYNPEIMVRYLLNL